MIDGLSRRAFDDLTGRIEDASVRQAFHHLTTGLRDLGRFELRPNIRGQKKALHFASGRVSYYAFVANNHWLLWYFRAPGFRDGIFTWEGLAERFPDLGRSRRSEPEKAEAILRITDLDGADAVLGYVSGLHRPVRAG